MATAPRWRGREESVSKRGRLRFREGLTSDGIWIERRSESAFDGTHFIVVAQRGRRRRKWRMGAHNHCNTHEHTSICISSPQTLILIRSINQSILTWAELWFYFILFLSTQLRRGWKEKSVAHTLIPWPDAFPSPFPSGTQQQYRTRYDALYRMYAFLYQMRYIWFSFKKISRTNTSFKF